MVLAGPILLAATNPRPGLHWLEVGGIAAWAVCWSLENLADFQMRSFVSAAKKNGDIRTAVLGHGAYAGPEYWLWAKCRHPNYFFEWMCWNSFVLAAVPSAADLIADPAQGLGAKLGAAVALVYTSRIFYDCLVHWTGAAPAESRSVTRRPAYKEHQASTRVLFPFEAPFFDHYRVPGWPLSSDKWQN